MSLDDLKFVGAVAGVGSGLSKVAVGHGFVAEPSFLEGFLALYKGATPPAVGWAAIDSLLLGSLHNYRLFLAQTQTLTEPVPGGDVRRLTVLGHGTAGLFAGLTSAVLATPVELLKVKLQLQNQISPNDRQFQGPIDCGRKILRVQGLSGLWTGFTGSLAFRSNFFFMFGSFEAFMRLFSSLQGTKYDLGTGMSNFLSGGLGAFAFWGMAIPADNIKNRMMAHPLVYPQGPADIRRPSWISVARQIYGQAGIQGFYRGLAPCLLRAFPTNACAFFVYEGTLRLMNADKTRH